MRFIDIQGVRLETAHIPGPTHLPPLVFLHEGLGSVGQWQQRGRDWPRELCEATGRAGWLYSRRGYGQSDPIPDVRGPGRWPNGSPGGWHMGRHGPDYMHLEARQVLPAWLQAIGVERPVLIGHSDGATIALLHASDFAVSGCVVMAPHLRVEPIAIQAIAQARAAYTAADGGLRQRLARHHRDVDNAFWQWNDVWLSDAFQAFDIRETCQRITAPLLAVQGLDDEYGTLQQLDDVALAVPHSQRLELPQCGHSPHRDQPDALTAAIAAWLAAA